MIHRSGDHQGWILTEL